MAFDVGGGGKKKGRASPDMNVTPRVDVVLVLLIIFMVVTPMLAKQFWVHVPPEVDENDPPPCLEDTDDRLITNSIDTFATDRRTAMATDKTKYLAEDAVVHEGLVNKWPFNAEKKTYPYWNGNSNFWANRCAAHSNK